MRTIGQKGDPVLLSRGHEPRLHQSGLRLPGPVSADTRKGAVVLGINADSVASHRKFMEEHGLPFTLLSDPDRTVLQACDVWKERSMFGKPVMGIECSTYLIDEEGTIIRAFGRVKPKDNARQMFREL